MGRGCGAQRRGACHLFKWKRAGCKAAVLDPRKMHCRLYRAVRDELVILGLHRDFLLFRDCAAATWCMVVLLSPAAFWLAENWPPVALYTLELLAQAVVTMRAARDRGERFVTTVLALAASG